MIKFVDDMDCVIRFEYIDPFTNERKVKEFECLDGCDLIQPTMDDILKDILKRELEVHLVLRDKLSIDELYRPSVYTPSRNSFEITYFTKFIRDNSDTWVLVDLKNEYDGITKIPIAIHSGRTAASVHPDFREKFSKAYGLADRMSLLKMLYLYRNRF